VLRIDPARIGAGEFDQNPPPIKSALIDTRPVLSDHFARIDPVSAGGEAGSVQLFSTGLPNMKEVIPRMARGRDSS
jgi:hypothetical protein